MADEQPQLPGEWPEIRRTKAAGKTGWTYFANLVKVLVDELGEERTADIMGKFMARNAQQFFLPGMKGFGITGNDPWAIASYFKLATGDIIGYKAELAEESPKKVVYRLHPPCLWFPDLDIPPSFCKAMGNFERVAAEIVNPKIKITTRKLMTDGDPCCELVFEEED